MYKIDGYKFGPKGNWRRWQWNRIVERLSVAPRDALVLYLPGKDDLDRREAIRRGFRVENLIAIDTNNEVIDKMRKNGNIAIRSKLSRVALAWSGEPSIDVIVADYCCGMETEVADLQLALITSSGISSNVVVSANLQRGRDKVRQAAKSVMECFGVDLNKEFGKHRGVHFMLSIRMMLDFMVHGGNPCKIGIIDKIEEDRISLSNKYWEFIMSKKPVFNSYRSNSGKNLFFDSLVFNFIITRESRKILSRTLNEEILKPYAAKISAAKAIRTRRANGTLPMASSW
jgi:hypothetical protein